MRTTIDMPDSLSRRLKRMAAERKTTMRALVLQAVKQSLDTPPGAFRLRDAAAGQPGHPTMDVVTVNQAIDSLRETGFRS